MAEIRQQEEAPSPPLPSGVVTFLLTDVEGSTRLWEEHFDAMSKALEQHDEIVTGTVPAHRGVVIKSRSEGDSQFLVFAAATDAVAAALDLQRAFAQRSWPTPSPIKVRMAIHTGDAGLQAGEYFGPAITRAARIRAVAHGGQVVVSNSARDSLDGTLPPDAVLEDLGSHRLRDLATPERIYQLVYPDLETAFPPLLSLDAHPNNLPLRLTSFVGREWELAELKALLERERLVTLTGPEGVGKTRLALQAAADVLEEYPHGVWFVDLESTSDSDALPALLARSIGVRGDGKPPVVQIEERRTRHIERGLIDYLKPYRLLVILDGCEGLGPACAQLVEPILRTCPGVSFLATSSGPLGVLGEAHWPVPPLPVPDPELPCSPDSLARFDSARLFVERAKLARPNFDVSESDARWVAQIVRTLEGHPGRVEIAAGWIKVLSAEQIAQRLADNPERLLRRKQPT